jgi:hypothetical protein
VGMRRKLGQTDGADGGTSFSSRLITVSGRWRACFLYCGLR